jgi:uncharacterized protein
VPRISQSRIRAIRGVFSFRGKAGNIFTRVILTNQYYPGKNIGSLQRSREMDSKYCTAFEGNRCIASGTTVEVAKKVKRIIERGEKGPVLIFDDDSSELVEIDFRGLVDEVLQRLETPATTPDISRDEAPRGPGRPKLGIVSREVSLLPRHWDWLNAQPGGASVALRKLVEEARRVNRDRDKVRRSQEVTYRFMSAMAGNMPGFEEATRALFAGNPGRFDELTEPWPADVRDHARRISAAAFRR